MLGYMHNESMNVFSHLGPAVYFMVHMVLALSGLGDYSVFQNWQSKLFMAFAALACSFDMWTSVAYHLFNTMGVKQGETLLKYDLSGIVAVMLSTFVVLAFNLFADWKDERMVILGVLTPLLLANFWVILHPSCAKDSMHCYKVIVIAVT